LPQQCFQPKQHKRLILNSVDGFQDMYACHSTMTPVRRNKISPQKKPRRRYTHAKKRQMVAKMLEASTRGLEAETGIPKSNLSRWMQQKDKLLSFDGSMKRFNLDGAGRPEEIPDITALIAFMLKLREAERAVTCTHIVNYLKRHHRKWLDTYLGEKHRGYQTLLRLLQMFCGRHGFTRQRPTKAKRLQGDLGELRKAFALDFHTAFDTIFNVDETGMSYDMPPKAIWAVGVEVQRSPAAKTFVPYDSCALCARGRHLRDLRLEEELIQGDDEEEDVDMITVTAQRKRLAMVQRGIKAWARITPQEIRRSFAKAIP
ncbi:hypothetical protein DYB26_016092, partial [Aphanomyces astaci]